MGGSGHILGTTPGPKLSQSVSVYNVYSRVACVPVATSCPLRQALACVCLCTLRTDVPEVAVTGH